MCASVYNLSVPGPKQKHHLNKTVQHFSSTNNLKSGTEKSYKEVIILMAIQMASED